MSTDPALGDYIPSTPINDEARKANGNLVNMHLYHYAGNDPVKYVDPDGRSALLGIAIIGYLALTALYAKNTGEANAEKAKIMSAQTGLPGAHNGKQDAVRHTLWNALNARDLGSGCTDLIGSMHEAKPSQPDAERKMDLHNNAVGKEIGLKNPNATDEELLSLVLNTLNDNELIVSIPEKSEATYNYGDSLRENYEAPIGLNDN